MEQNGSIPIYSLNSFKKAKDDLALFQVEVFDANRHFEVAYPHKHDFYEILFLNSGSGFHIIDGNKYEIKPPCIFFMSPGQTHKLSLSADIGGYIFLFTEEFYYLNPLNDSRLLSYPFFYSINQENPPLLLQNTDDAKFLASLFKRGALISQESKNQNPEFIRATLELIMQTCMLWYPQEHVKIAKTRSQILVKAFLKLMEENYQNNLSVANYASMLAITSNHLSQMVKKATGKTPITLLQNKVVIEAKRLLIHSEMTVTEIADYLNFADQSYFTKYFKKACGLTPLQYKKNNMELFEQE